MFELFTLGIFATINSCQIQQCVPTQQQIMTEKIVSIIESKGKVVYRLGCNGKYNSICRSNGYDCSGLIDSTRRDVGFYNERKLNSSRIKEAGKEIEIGEAKRGDYLHLNRTTGTGLNHIAIISRGWNGKDVEILDFTARPGYVSPRKIKVTNGKYAGIFKVSIIRIDYSKTLKISRKTGKLLIL